MLHTKKVGYLDGSPEDLIMSQWNETKTASKNRNCLYKHKSLDDIISQITYESKHEKMLTSYYAFEYDSCCKVGP